MPPPGLERPPVSATEKAPHDKRGASREDRVGQGRSLPLAYGQPALKSPM